MAKYKVGDKVLVKNHLNGDDQYYMEDKCDYWYPEQNMIDSGGKVVTIKAVNEKGRYYLCEGFDDSVDYWTDEMFVGLAEETPAPEPTPEPIEVTINVTVNINYDNACWYCRKGGLADIYFGGRPGICPHCGRACNAVAQSTQCYKPVEPVKEDKKENKPLTDKELDALPDGTRVFTVWINSGHPMLNHVFTCWRTKQGNTLRRNHGTQDIRRSNGVKYYAYLEMPDGAVDSGK